MALVLGIDPGSLKMGYGIINVLGDKHHYVASGVLRLSSELALADKLKTIFTGVCEVIEQYQPQEFAIEQVFMAKSAASALKLGQARGAAIVAATHHNLPVSEYEARKVKKSIVGTGAADKWQMQHMVSSLLKLSARPAEDAADALAIAICHANNQQNLVRMAGSRHFRRGRMV